MEDGPKKKRLSAQKEARKMKSIATLGTKKKRGNYPTWGGKQKKKQRSRRDRGKGKPAHKKGKESRGGLSNGEGEKQQWRGENIGPKTGKTRGEIPKGGGKTPILKPPETLH